MSIIVIRIEKLGDLYWGYSKHVEGLDMQGETISDVKKGIDNLVQCFMENIAPEDLPKQLQGDFKIVYKFHPDEVVDFGDDEQMANDLWLFVARNANTKSSWVNKENFLHEAKAMFTSIREYERLKSELKYVNSEGAN